MTYNKTALKSIAFNDGNFASNLTKAMVKREKNIIVLQTGARGDFEKS